MSLTITKVSFSGDRQYAGTQADAEGVFDILWDSSYPTGGEVFDVSAWFATVQAVDNMPGDVAANGLAQTRPVGHNRGTAAAGLLFSFVEDGTSGVQAQVADMTDLSGVTAQRVRVRGTRLLSYSA